MTTVVGSTALALPDGLAPGWIAFADGEIVDLGVGALPSGATDLGDRVVAPGFVDLQCNGVGRVDLASATPSEWREARRALAGHGVTSFCPTFVTAPLDDYGARLDAAAAAQAATRSDESAIVGVHLEGPFLGGAPGAHDPGLVREVDLAWLGALLDDHPGLVRLVTLAPEADPGLGGVRLLTAAGVVVALGHTTASTDQALAAAAAGASVVTHLFNGMAPWHHRAPGVAGAALVDDRLTPTVIADLVHVDPYALRLAFAATRLAVVSDAVGTSAPVDGAARLADGTLAGATTLLDGALANLVRIGIPLMRAIESTTAVPARLVGCDDRGTLAIGARADLIALDAESLAVERVWSCGEEVDASAH